MECECQHVCMRELTILGSRVRGPKMVHLPWNSDHTHSTSAWKDRARDGGIGEERVEERRGLRRDRGGGMGEERRGLRRDRGGGMGEERRGRINGSGDK